METTHHPRPSVDMTPREYHARRDARRLAAREALRQLRLDAARQAILRLAPRYPGVETGAACLDELRRFRHLFRAAYGMGELLRRPAAE